MGRPRLGIGSSPLMSANVTEVAPASQLSRAMADMSPREDRVGRKARLVAAEGRTIAARLVAGQRVW